jgi:hypothetical protein
MQIVEDYSERDITFPEDRLPALAGLAAELQKLWKDDYIAGMWRGCLLRHLAWGTTHRNVYPSAEDDLSDFHVPLEYHSPGWSWTSYKGRVHIYEVAEEHAQVVECSVTLLDKTAPLSRVRGGRLVLSAACISEEQRLKWSPEDCWIQWDYNDCVQLKPINKEFRYALLGYGMRQRGDNVVDRQNGIGLVLAPVGDGTFMKIGVLGFPTKHWPPEIMERQIITII